MKEQLYKQWVDGLAAVAIKPISDDTAAKLLAIVYIYGGSMELIFNVKIRADICYAQRRAGLFGGNIPDAKMVRKIKKYIKDIEKFLKTARSVQGESPFAIEHPSWVEDFMSERYGINKMWL